MTSTATPGPRRLRADAARNHRAIVTAARDAFEAGGPDVALDDIARRAGVGTSTLYRRFATRDELIGAVAADYVDHEIEPALRRASADPEPGRALAGVLSELVDAVLRHRGLLALLRERGGFGADAAARFLEPLDELLDRGRAAGTVREDLVARDVPALVMMVVAASGPARGDAVPGAQDRYLRLVLDALAPAAATTPLPPPPAGRVSSGS